MGNGVRVVGDTGGPAPTRSGWAGPRSPRNPVRRWRVTPWADGPADAVEVDAVEPDEVEGDEVEADEGEPDEGGSGDAGTVTGARAVEDRVAAEDAPAVEDDPPGGVAAPGGERGDGEGAGAEEAGAGVPRPATVPARRARRARRALPERRRRAGIAVLAVLAVLGLVGTLAFGLAWAGQQAQQQGEAQAKKAATTLLVDLTNFNAKTVDADFSAITAMATGSFAGQAATFFNSSIRQELETALASSRGQVRDLYVQTYTGSKASVYAVVDQLYANNKITAPQSDVLRIVVDLADTPSGWKVSDVTVLEGPSVTSGSGTGTGSATAPTGTTPAG